MIIMQGEDMWTIFRKTDYFCVTTNSMLTQKGALVMGGGMALQAAQQIPGLAQRAGRLLLQYDLVGKCYGLMDITPVKRRISPKIIAFQTKRNWRFPSEMEVIQESTSILSRVARKRSGKRFDLNFPGIGKGKLDRGSVLEVIKILPDNCYIWEL